MEEGIDFGLTSFQLRSFSFWLFTSKQFSLWSWGYSSSSEDAHAHLWLFLSPPGHLANISCQKASHQSTAFLAFIFLNAFFPNHLKILLEGRRTAPKSLWHHLLLHYPGTHQALGVQERGPQRCPPGGGRRWPPPVPRSGESNSSTQMSLWLFPSCWGYSSCWVTHLLWVRALPSCTCSGGSQTGTEVFTNGKTAEKECVNLVFSFFSTWNCYIFANLLMDIASIYEFGIFVLLNSSCFYYSTLQDCSVPPKWNACCLVVFSFFVLCFPSTITYLCYHRFHQHVIHCTSSISRNIKYNPKFTFEALQYISPFKLRKPFWSWALISLLVPVLPISVSSHWGWSSSF